MKTFRSSIFHGHISTSIIFFFFFYHSSLFIDLASSTFKLGKVKVFDFFFPVTSYLIKVLRI